MSSATKSTLLSLLDGRDFGVVRYVCNEGNFGFILKECIDLKKVRERERKGQGQG